MEESRDHHCFIRRLFWTLYFYREIKGNLIWLAIKGTICFRFFVVKYLHDDCFAIKSWFEVLMWLMVYSIIINIALGYLSVWHITKKTFFCSYDWSVVKPSLCSHGWIVVVNSLVPVWNQTGRSRVHKLKWISCWRRGTLDHHDIIPSKPGKLCVRAGFLPLLP